MEQRLIYAEQISKIYKSNGKKNAAETKALDAVDLEIQKGEILAITGASGSGKSTLLHMLGGIDTPSNGRIYYGQEDITKFSDKRLSEFRREKIGFVFQSFQLLPELTVEQNIMLPWKLQHKKPDKKDIETILRELGMEEKKEAYPEQLSGGQQQRTAIARALVHQPDLLLCDEPIGNLDYQNGQEVMKLLFLSREKRKQTIVIVTHDEKIAGMADRIYKMRDGKIIQ